MVRTAVIESCMDQYRVEVEDGEGKYVITLKQEGQTKAISHIQAPFSQPIVPIGCPDECLGTLELVTEESQIIETNHNNLQDNDPLLEQQFENL